MDRQGENRGDNRPMEYTGINHIAFVTHDMAKTVDFYTNVLEMPLIKTLDYPNNQGQHFFFDAGKGDVVAFFSWPDSPCKVEGVASRHADHKKYGVKTAEGSMNHMAITVPLEKIDEYVARLRSRGVDVLVDDAQLDGLLDTGWVKSAHFQDPNGVSLELAAYKRPLSDADVAHAPINAKGEAVSLESIRSRAR